MQAKQQQQQQRSKQGAVGSNLPAAHHHQQWWKHVFGPEVKTVATVGSALLLLVGPSGDWMWPAAWVTVLGAAALVLLPIYLYLQAFNPDLITERERFLGNKGTADFELQLVPAVVALIPVRFLAAGVQHYLQLQQPGWSPTRFLSTPGQQAAAVVLLSSYFLQTWAVCTNKYFSSVVRIQSDRGHKVCSSGPYAYIRHPGYVAFSLQGIAEAVLLESSWAMAAAVLKFVVLVVRTVKENTFLKASLTGYAAYAQRVPYSWVPFVW